MRSAVALIVCAAVLALVDFSIAGKERLLAAGKPVYLELAPVDPRSLSSARSRSAPPRSRRRASAAA